jgi:hypothetical protein
MGLTVEERKVLKGSDGGVVVAPEMARIPVAVAVTGLSRSAIYRLAAEGKIVLRKAGRTTLVDMASARACLADLPRAVVRAPRGDAA